MKSTVTLAVVFLFASALSYADFETRVVTYQLGDTTFESTVVWESDEADEALPGILMIPNWMGPTEASLKKAKKVAEYGYVVMMVDMYGVDVRPTNSSEAGAAAGTLRSDRPEMRARAAKALAEFRGLEDVPLDASKVAAIGFCFGGGTVLELARAGADIDAVVSFHGDLLSPTLESDASQVKSKVLVLHGADDPYVPQDHVSQFIAAMQTTEADWQLVQFANTVHSFTDPLANAVGQADYNPVSARRAFEYMEELLEEIWELDD
jgi:dienelactone hydrolase